MIDNFSEIDKTIIHNMMFTKSHAQIAKLLGYDIEDVAELIDTFTQGTLIRTYQMLLDDAAGIKHMSEPKFAIDKPKVVKRRKVVEKPKSSRQIEREQMREYAKAREQARERALLKSGDNDRQRTFTNKKVDMNQLKSVRIDRKTSILVRIGEDEEQAKQRYLRTIMNSKSIYKKDIA